MKTKRYRRRRKTLSWAAAAARLRWTAAAPAGFLRAARALTLFVGAILLADAGGAFAQNTFDVGTNLVDVSRMKGNETDPTDAASHLNFSVAAGAGNSVIVTFSPWQGGRAYQLEAATNLANPAWITLTNGFTVTTNGAGVFTVQPGNASGVFYRLSAQVIP
jgi:hypothetical protein